MTEITPFTAVPNRGQSQEDLVNTTNTFFSEVGGFVTSANALRQEIQDIAEFSIYSNPVWEAKAYTADYSVNYEGNCYISTDATLATDVPGVSAKWKQTNASSSGADIQVFTSSGTWTKPEGAKMVRIILCGGGGGGASGGKCGTNTTYVLLGGGGGGGAGVADITVPASLLNATQSVTIGAGGIGGVFTVIGDATYGYDGTNGGAGGNTVFSGFTAYGGTGGKKANRSYSIDVPCASGGNSYISSTANLLLDTPNNSSMEVESTFNGATLLQIGYVGLYKKQFSIYGGCCSQMMVVVSGSYTYSNIAGVPSIFGGSAGGTGYGVYLNSVTPTRAIAYSNLSSISPTKFLPSYFGSYTSVGGNGGSMTLTSNGTSGTNATGYGAGGGGGASCTENYTAGNGGNGSPGIAIIISW